MDVGEGKHRLEMMADLVVAPMKQWWLPLTWLLPDTLHAKVGPHRRPSPAPPPPHPVLDNLPHLLH